MTKTRKHTNFLALFLSLVMALSLMPAPVFAEAFADYYQKTDSFKDGGQYVIAVQSGEDWYAVTGETNSADQTVVSKATKVNVNEDNVIENPDALTIWNYASGSKQISNQYGSLYFSSEGLKYQSQGYRGVTFENEKLYAHSTDGTTSGKDIYLKLDLNASRPFATVVSDTSGSVSGEAKVAIFEKLSDEEAEAYEKRKQEEQDQKAIELEKEILRGILNALVAQENLDEYSEANQTKIKEVVDAARPQVEAAASFDDIDAIVKYISDAVNAVPTKEQEEQQAVEEEKIAANAELDKLITDENLAQYDEANQAKIKEAVEAARPQIEAAGTVDAIKSVVASLKDTINAIPKKTDPQPTPDPQPAPGPQPTPADPAKEAKDAAAKELEAAKAATGYDAEEKAQITNIINVYTTKIEAAKTADEVKALVAQFNAEVKALPTAAQKSAIKKTAVKIKSVKAGKKKMTVKWKSNKAKFDGYQVKYQLKGKKKWKTATVKKASTAKKVIKKLKKGKKYKVKVRGYKMFGVKKDVKVYGKYSKTKTSKKIK